MLPSMPQNYLDRTEVALTQGPDTLHVTADCAMKASR